MVLLFHDLHSLPTPTKVSLLPLLGLPLLFKIANKVHKTIPLNQNKYKNIDFGWPYTNITYNFLTNAVAIVRLSVETPNHMSILNKALQDVLEA